MLGKICKWYRANRVFGGDPVQELKNLQPSNAHFLESGSLEQRRTLKNREQSLVGPCALVET
jgi:hypothetical protein